MDDKALVERVLAWLDGGCSSWNVPSSDIRKMATRIEQKAREIAESQHWLSHAPMRVEAARLGIIEGLEMAHRRLALVYLTNEATACEVYLEGLQDAAAAILALIEEQKV